MRRTVSEPTLNKAAPHVRTPTQRGFTLVELIVAITLLGILAMVTVPLLQLPMSAYVDATRRATTASEIDATAAKLRADLGTALPNSIRIDPTRRFLEYMEVRAVGRFRNGSDGTPASCPATCGADVMQFACNESCFTTLGQLQGSAPVVGSDYVVINPLGPGIPNGDPYFGGTAFPVGGIKSRLQTVTPTGTGNRITMTAHAFALAPANKRFYLVSTPVTYECNLATRRLTRRWGYAVAAVQPVAFGGGTLSAPLALQVQGCRFDYTATGAAGGVVTVRLQHSGTAAGAAVSEVADSVLEFGVRETW